MSQTLGVGPGYLNLQVGESPRPSTPRGCPCATTFMWQSYGFQRYKEGQPFSRKKVGDHPGKLLYWQTWVAGGRTATGDLEEHLLPPAQLPAEAAPWVGSPGIITMLMGCFYGRKTATYPRGSASLLRVTAVINDDA